MVFRSGSREGEIESRSENNKGSFPFALTTCIAPEPAFVSQTCLMLAIFGQNAKWHNTGFSRYCGLFEGAGMQKIALEFVCEVESNLAMPGRYGVGTTACTSFEYVLSTDWLSTAVAT